MSPESKERLSELEQKIETYHHTDPQRAEELCGELQALARELGDQASSCVADYYQTTIVTYKAAPREALRHVLRLRERCRGVAGTEHLLVLLDNLEGTIHDDCGELQEAMRCYLDGLTQAEKQQDDSMQMHLWGNIACLFMELKQYDMALQDLDRAQQHLSRMPEGAHRRYCQQVVDLNMAEIQLNLGHPERTLALLDRSIPSLGPEALVSDLQLPAEYLRAWAEEKLGNHKTALSKLAEVIRRAGSARIARESWYETLKLEAQLCIQQGEQARAIEAIEAIKAAGYASASLINALDCATTRVAYCRRFLGKEEQLAAYDRCYELRQAYQEEERRSLAEAMELRMKLKRTQAEKDAALRDGEHLLDLSGTDELTGLPNRRRWQERLQETLHKAAAAGEDIGVVLLDVDEFKHFNDTQGHLIGDRIICLAAKALRLEEERFFPGRFGGDEFILICRGESETEIERFLDRVYFELRMSQEELAEDMPRITFSAGYAVRSAKEVRVGSDLIDEADHALYHAKNSCRNCYRRYHG